MKIKLGKGTNWAEVFLVLVILFLWTAGFVIAKGIFSTAFCIIPFWAFYLSIEHFMVYFGLI